MGNPLCELLREVVIETHRGVIRAVAMRAGLAERTVYDHCTDGRVNASVEVIRAAFEVTQDPRLKKILTPDGWELVPAQPAIPPTRDFEREMGDVEMAVSDLRRQVRQALDNDGHIDGHELVAIQCRCGEIRKQADEVEALALEESRGLRVMKI